MDGDKSNEPRIIEVAHGLQNRNIFINLDDLEAWRKKQSDDLEIHSSYFRYFTDDPNIGGVLAGFGMDFDDEQNPERARKEAIIVIKDLMNRFDIDENSISICFSGNKGFHIFINRRVFGVEPEYFLPKIYKSMGQELIERHGLKTLDLKIYDRRRLLRLPGSRHQKSGLYKIPLTREELEKFNIDKIKSLAVRPRPLIMRNEHKLSERAHKWYLQHREKVLNGLREKKVEFTEQDFKGDFPPCVKRRLEEGAKEGERNRCAWQLASYLLKRGMKKDEVSIILEKWRQRCDRGLHEFSHSELQRTIDKVYEVGGYSIGCGSEAFEPFCAGQDNCGLFKRGGATREEEIPAEAFIEAEKILFKGDPLEYIQNCVNQIHAGDGNLIRLAYISALSVKLSSVSLHLWPIGTSQKGKSHMLNTVIRVLPRDHYETFTSASPLSLFYYVKEYGENALNGKLIFIDEVESSKLAIPMLRSLTGQTEITPRHLSVYEGDLIDLKIKGRRVIWFTSTKTIEDDQIRNRFIFCNPDESKEQDEAVHKLQILRIKEKVDEDKFTVAKALTKTILNEAGSLEAVIPYLSMIKWPYKERRWLFPLFIATIEAITKINYRKRNIFNGKVISEKEDFMIAKELWKDCIEHTIYRCNESAERVLKVLSADPTKAKTKAEIAAELDLSTQRVGQLLEELLELDLVDRRLRENREAGRPAYEYWRISTSVEEIELDTSNPQEGNFENFENEKSLIEEKAASHFNQNPRSSIFDFQNFQNYPMESAILRILDECGGEAGILLIRAEARKHGIGEEALDAALKELHRQGLIILGVETVKLAAFPPGPEEVITPLVEEVPIR